MHASIVMKTKESAANPVRFFATGSKGPSTVPTSPHVGVFLSRFYTISDGLSLIDWFLQELRSAY